MAGTATSGRKGFGQEVASMKEEIKKRAIEELAESIVYNRLEAIEEQKDKQGVKEIALPVYLKSKADKVDHTSKGEQIKSINYIIPDGNNNSSSNSEATSSV